MKVILAFDSFKGSLTAPMACAAAGAGLARLSPAWELTACPLSDGGEGFAEALRLAGGGTAFFRAVTGPLFTPVRAEMTFLDDGRRAVVESAQGCGLGLVPAELRSPVRTTSRGVGEMLLAACQSGAREVIVGLGGSSTNDAGLGLLSALGWRFLDDNGHDLRPVGASLSAVAAILPGQRLPGTRIVVACDVRNPLYGPEGAARVFAAQKGAAPYEVAELDRGLTHFAAICHRFLGEDFSLRPGAGAAGGLGFALQAFLGAEFRPGAEVAIEAVHLDGLLRGADLCLTGEGQTDYQTVYGKLPAAVAGCAAQAGVPCICLSGALGLRWREVYASGFTAICSISQRPASLRQAIAGTSEALADAAEAVGRVFIAGCR